MQKSLNKTSRRSRYYSRGNKLLNYAHLTRDKKLTKKNVKIKFIKKKWDR